MNPNNTIPNEEIVRQAEKEEPRLLGILLKDKEAIGKAISHGIIPSEDGKPGHFLFDKNNYLYTLIKMNYTKYGSLLTRSAMDSLMDVQEGGTEEQRSGMKTYWDKVWNRHDVDTEDLGLLLENINSRYIKWQFFEVFKGGGEIIKSTSSSLDSVTNFIAQVNAINNLDPDKYSLTMSMEEGIGIAMDHVKERRDNPIDPDTIKTGLKALDDIYNGFGRGTYTIVSGMVNGGKTTLLMNIGFNMAKAGYNVAYVSMEKKAELFYRRLLALHSSTDYNRIKKGGTGEWGLTDHWYKKLQEGATDLVENVKPHYDCLQFVPLTPLTKILNEVDKIRKIKALDVLIVDYLDVIGRETTHIGRSDLELADVHQRLLAYGQQNNLVLINATQLKNSASKEVRNKASKVGTDEDVSSVEVNTEDYGGSMKIVADADNAFSCVLNADHPPTKMYVSLSKSRDAESRRTITLDFDGKLGRIADPEYTPQQIQATHDLLYDSNVDNAQLERSLTSDDDLFTSVTDADGAVVSDSDNPLQSAPVPDVIEELDNPSEPEAQENEGETKPENDGGGDDLPLDALGGIIDIDDDGDISDIFGDD